MAREAKEQPNFREIIGYKGDMVKLTNHDTRPLNAKFDGRDVILDPNEYTILPEEVGRHLLNTFTQGTHPFELEMKAVKTEFRDADEPLRDEEAGLEAPTLKELIAKVRDHAVAKFRSQKGEQGAGSSKEDAANQAQLRILQDEKAKLEADLAALQQQIHDTPTVAAEATDSERSARAASHPNSVATGGIARGNLQTPGGGQPTASAEANKGPDGGESANTPESLAQRDDAVAAGARRR